MEQDNFIEEMLAESAIADEKKQIEMNSLRADQLLKAVEVLENKMGEVNQLANDEIKLIEQYRANELARLDKQRSWLVFNLESYARTTGEKTIRLPHGILRLRKGRDKAVVVELEKFLPMAQRFGLLKKVPESYTPDLLALLAYVKRTGDVPVGTDFIAAGTKFSYSTNGGKEDDNEQQAEG